MNQTITAESGIDKLINKFNPFHKPTHISIAKESLEEYQRRLLASQDAAAYHAKMVEYYHESVQRLRKYQG